MLVPANRRGFAGLHPTEIVANEGTSGGPRSNFGCGLHWQPAQTGCGLYLQPAQTYDCLLSFTASANASTAAL